MPQVDRDLILNLKDSCGVPGLVKRKIRIFAADSAEFEIDYWQPFNQNLFDYLATNSDVAGFEFIGERLKYFRLKKALDYLNG